jgi:hypothetical protein
MTDAELDYRLHEAIEFGTFDKESKNYGIAPKGRSLFDLYIMHVEAFGEPVGGIVVVNEDIGTKHLRGPWRVAFGRGARGTLICDEQVDVLQYSGSAVRVVRQPWVKQ